MPRLLFLLTLLLDYQLQLLLLLLLLFIFLFFSSCNLILSFLNIYHLFLFFSFLCFIWFRRICSNTSRKNLSEAAGDIFNHRFSTYWSVRSLLTMRFLSLSLLLSTSQSLLLFLISLSLSLCVSPSHYQALLLSLSDFLSSFLYLFLFFKFSSLSSHLLTFILFQHWW